MGSINWLQKDAPALLNVLSFFLIWLIVWLPIAIPLAIRLQWNPLKPITPAQKLPLILSLYLLVFPVLLGFTQLEGFSWNDLGLSAFSSLWASALAGLVLGAFGLLLLFILEGWLGWLQWQPIERVALLKTLPLTLMLGLGISFTEELIFRGFLQYQLQQEYVAIGAAAIASFIFAVLHLVWEGPSTVPQLPGLWLMGMVLALSRWADDGHLGLAWGLHAGWIWVMASLESVRAIAYENQAPSWLTGIKGQPLAGILGLSFLLLTGAALWGMGLNMR